MAKPIFTNSISVGNLIQVGVFLVAGVAAYKDLDARSKNNASAISSMQVGFTANTMSIRALEISDSKQDTQNTAIRREISEVKDAISEANSLLRQLLSEGRK